MYNSEERLRLEQTIIGVCLLERGFEQVKDILLHSDFKHPNYLIYTAFIRLNESGDAITPRTVFRILEKVKKHVDPSYLTHCMMIVSQWYHPQRHCLQLLEYKLEDDMVKICGKYTGENSIDAQLSSNCLQKIAEYTDPLKTMDLIAAYLHKRSPESLLTKEVINLNKNFVDRCHKIRQNLKK